MALVIETVDLGYGDSGKGTIVDWLARRHGARLVVRYNGGAQAAHNVIDDEGRHHTFSQFGSGTLAGSMTFLSRFMLVNPVAMLPEARHLEALGIRDPLSRVVVDGSALVTTPYHMAANRIREMARSSRHGSCGMGIGETMQDFIMSPHDVLRVGDLKLLGRSDQRAVLNTLRDRKLEELKDEIAAAPDGAAKDREIDVLRSAEIRERILDRFAAFAEHVFVADQSWLSSQLSADGVVIFEAAQGVLLDQNYGFQPHTTWTDITLRNAAALRHGSKCVPMRLGIVRAFATRHGAGPMPTEDPAMQPLLAGDHNTTGEWQGTMRAGHIDLVTMRYAADVIGGVDAVAVTCLDLISDGTSACIGYRNADPAFFDGFDVQNNVATRIHVVRPSSLGHQTRLTSALHRVQPVLVDASPDDVCGLVSEWAGAPVSIRSFGPRPRDKMEAPGWIRATQEIPPRVRLENWLDRSEC